MSLLKRSVLLIPLAAAGIALAACSGGASISPQPTTNAPAASTPSTNVCPWAPNIDAGTAACQQAGRDFQQSLTPPAPPEPAQTDFTIDLKTTSKHCFGSAGCNVEVEPNLSYNGDPTALDEWTCDVTYEIDGGQSPVIDTAKQHGQQFSYSATMLSTASSSATLSAKISAVSCQQGSGF